MSILKSTNIGRCSFEVDLGLSVNWCAYNIGAKKPEEAGLYFAWGDTKGYKKSEITKDMFTPNWYKTLHAYKIERDLKLNEDAAHEYLKGKWRMPTDIEIQELVLNTNQSVEFLNGIKGIQLTAKNENSIFIPFASYAEYGSIMVPDDVLCCWSSTIDDYTYAYDLYGSEVSGYSYKNSLNRFLGFSIRAVCDK